MLLQLLALCGPTDAVTTTTATTTAVPVLSLVQTARDTGDRLSPCPAPRFGPAAVPPPDAAWSVIVQRAARRQRILGFGGAFTDAAVVNFAALDATTQRRLLDAYWGRDGIGYTLGRIPINSCDFTTSTYSFDEVPGDVALAHFDTSLSRDRTSIVPLVRRAMSAAAAATAATAAAASANAAPMDVPVGDHQHRPHRHPHRDRHLRPQPATSATVAADATTGAAAMLDGAGQQQPPQSHHHHQRQRLRAMSATDASIAHHRVPRAARPALRLIASPWSAPTWMKIPHPGQRGQGMNGSAAPLGLVQTPSVLQAWALYFSKWIAAYARYGIPIWAVTVQNEPQALQVFESCLFTAEAERDFVRDFLGPRLRADFPAVRILAWDHNKYTDPVNPQRNMTYWARTLYGDARARGYIDGLAFHWYQIFEDSGYNFAVLDAVHAMDPSKLLLNTEACVCPVQLDQWVRGEMYAYDILGDLAHWSSGWIDWNLLLDSRGGPNHVGASCDAPILRLDNGTLHFQPQFYYMGAYVCGGRRRTAAHG